MSSAQTDKVETIVSEPNLDEPLAKPAFTAGWGEVLAVAAVGIVPNLVIALTSLATTSSALPYWLDAVQMLVLGGCTIYVTLYLIHRSGDPWPQFGICRPRALDYPLTLCLIAMAELIWYVQIKLVFLPTESSDYQFSRGRSNADYVWMVLKYAVGTFAEELVMRAYMITRLTTLLRSRGLAIFVAALLFGSYHIYQGWTGAVFAFVFGLTFGVAFLATRRIWPLAFAHAIYDIRVDMLW